MKSQIIQAALIGAALLISQMSFAQMTGFSMKTCNQSKDTCIEIKSDLGQSSRFQHLYRFEQATLMIKNLQTQQTTEIRNVPLKLNLQHNELSYSETLPGQKIRETYMNLTNMKKQSFLLAQSLP